MTNNKIYSSSEYGEIEKIIVQMNLHRNGINICYFDLLIPNFMKTDNKVLIIVARGYENPMEYPYETYTEINRFLNQLNLDISDFEILVDVYDFVGPYEQNIYLWELRITHDGIRDSVLKIDKECISVGLIEEIKILHDSF